MKRLPPSCPERGDIARGAAIRNGATPLESLIVGQVAAYGSVCWLKDRELAEDIVQRNGRRPHPRSVARARRNSARKGLMQSLRLMPGQRIEGKRTPVTYGTTAKVVVFDKSFGVRDPLTRGQRRKLRLRAMNAAVQAEYEGKTEPRIDAPKHSAPIRTDDRPPRLSHEKSEVITADAELAEVISQLGSSLQAKWDAQYAERDHRMMQTVPRGPPRR